MNAEVTARLTELQSTLDASKAMRDDTLSTISSNLEEWTEVRNPGPGP